MQLSLPVVLITFLFAGCASYQSKPLTHRVDLAPTVDQLTSPMVTPTDGLSLVDVANITVLNNPDLKAQRKRLGVAQVQLFAAGLLPDPHLSANLDSPTGSVPGVVNAFGVDLGYDMIPLANRWARSDSGQHALQQTHLEPTDGAAINAR
jgi:outer membrane protein TolC